MEKAESRVFLSRDFLSLPAASRSRDSGTRKRTIYAPSGGQPRSGRSEPRDPVYARWETLFHSWPRELSSPERMKYEIFYLKLTIVRLRFQNGEVERPRRREHLRNFKLRVSTAEASDFEGLLVSCTFGFVLFGLVRWTCAEH